MKRPILAFTALLAVSALGSTAASALPNCSGLGALASTSPGVLSITSVLTPAVGSTPAYCQVNLKYLREINIRVGLPLNAADGGTGSVQGAWNGKIQNLGGGGYAGGVGAVTGPVTAGYVGSSTDTGHNTAVCNANGQPNCGLAGGGFVLDSSNQLISTLVTDFIKDSLIEQVRWAKRLAKLYYGMEQSYNYWNGCSTGGRQGMEMAQKYGDQFDGILAGAPAMNWNRFIIGELWPAVVVKDIVGLSNLSSAKYNATNAAAIAACDALDGVTDGIINEPRRCNYNANALICTGAAGDPPTCLTPQEADAVNKIWDGPRNLRGQRLWGGLPRGTSFGTLLNANLNGPVADASGLITTYLTNWMHEDPSYDWHNVTMANFSAEFQNSDIKFQATASTDNPVLDKLKNSGGKMIHYHGIADPLIIAFGSHNYANRVFSLYGVAGTQSFMRSFFYPANGHCGGGPAGTPLINQSNLFAALVNWVENGVAPGHIVANSSGDTRSRKICKYPDEAVYSGSGSTDDHNNFHCVVNATEPADLAADSLTAKRFQEAP